MEEGYHSDGTGPAAEDDMSDDGEEKGYDSLKVRYAVEKWNQKWTLKHGEGQSYRDEEHNSGDRPTRKPMTIKVYGQRQ
jgi:hypothetical protein